MLRFDALNVHQKPYLDQNSASVKVIPGSRLDKHLGEGLTKRLQLRMAEEKCRCLYSLVAEKGESKGLVLILIT